MCWLLCHSEHKCIRNVSVWEVLIPLNGIMFVCVCTHKMLNLWISTLVKLVKIFLYVFHSILDFFCAPLVFFFFFRKITDFREEAGRERNAGLSHSLMHSSVGSSSVGSCACPAWGGAGNLGASGLTSTWPGPITLVLKSFWSDVNLFLTQLC